MAESLVEKFMTTDGTIRVSAVTCTELINEARQIHGSFPVATAALGRALIGAGLLASFLKDGSKVGLYFKGDGPLGPVFAEGNFEGHVRGYVTHPQIHVPSKNGKLNVGGGVGKGILNVTQSVPHEKQPYSGTVQIQSGEIGEDLAYYLFQSQQIPSIVALGVFVEPDNSVSAAGGCILQVMPGAPESTLEKLQERVTKIKPVTTLLREGASTSDLAYEMLEDFTFRKIDGSLKLKYLCHCSMVRVERSLLLIGPGEIQALVDKNEPAEVTCDFCGRRYSVPLDTLQDLLRIARKNSLN